MVFPSYIQCLLLPVVVLIIPLAAQACSDMLSLCDGSLHLFLCVFSGHGWRQHSDEYVIPHEHIYPAWESQHSYDYGPYKLPLTIRCLHLWVSLTEAMSVECFHLVVAQVLPVSLSFLHECLRLTCVLLPSYSWVRVHQTVYIWVSSISTESNNIPVANPWVIFVSKFLFCCW